MAIDPAPRRSFKTTSSSSETLLSLSPKMTTEKRLEAMATQIQQLENQNKLLTKEIAGLTQLVSDYTHSTRGAVESTETKIQGWFSALNEQISAQFSNVGHLLLKINAKQGAVDQMLERMGNTNPFPGQSPLRHTQFGQCHGFGNLSSSYPSGTFPTAGNGLNHSTHQFKDWTNNQIFKPLYQSINPTFTLAGLILEIESTKNGRQMLNFDMSFKFLHIGALAIVFKKAVPGTFTPAEVIVKIYDAYRNLAMSAPITLEENYLVYLEDSETGEYVPIQSVDSFEAWIKVKSNTRSDVNNNKQTLIDSIGYFTPFSLMGIITELKNSKTDFVRVLNFDFKFERFYMGNSSNTAIVLVYDKRDEGVLSHKGLGDKLEVKLQEQVELLSLNITDVTEKPFFVMPYKEGPLSMIQNAVGLVSWLDSVKKY